MNGINYKDIMIAAGVPLHSFYAWRGDSTRKPFIVEVTPTVAASIEAAKLKSKKKRDHPDNANVPAHLLERSSGPQTFEQWRTCKWKTAKVQEYAYQILIKQEEARKAEEQKAALARLGLGGNAPAMPTQEAAPVMPAPEKRTEPALPENFFHEPEPEPDQSAPQYREKALKRMNLDDLRTIAEQEGIDTDGLKKSEIVSAITNQGNQ